MDPQTRNKAEIWQPKAVEVKKISAAMFNYIDTVIAELNNSKSVELVFEKHGRSVQLFQKMTSFKQMVTEAIKPYEFGENQKMKAELQIIKNKFNLSISVDSVAYMEYFKNTNTSGALAMLVKIQNDILMAENREITFFNNSTTAIYHGYESFSHLISQNSSYLKAGQTIEIKAGVGAFSDASKPAITINGIKIPVDFDAVANYTMTVPDKPGKYRIPVTIAFTKPDGTTAIVEKNVEYTVAQ